MIPVTPGNTVTREHSDERKLTVSLPTQLIADARRYATLNGTTLQQLVTKGLRIVLGFDPCPDSGGSREEETLS